MALGPDALSLVQAPGKVSDLGIPGGLAEDLFLRRVLTERLTTVSRAADALSVSHAVGDELAEALRQKNLVEYNGVEGRDYRISLTELGQRMTIERMKSGQHVSRMPVPLADYKTLVQLQRADVNVNRAAVKQAYNDLVLEDSLLDQIGPAFLSDGAIFFYGPPGTGKTSLAERMSRFFDDKVLIPQFIEVDGQIISVYDPALHQAEPEQPPGLDPRYVLCHRPLVMVGGELTLSMMDLQFDASAGLSAPPIQLLANNGILVVDDFGRQTATPDEILNRWIVPLSRGIDFLKPNSGTKFTVPFELKLVISTNLDPHSLGDDAFLRRLRNKVYVGAASEAAFNWVLVRAADRHGLGVTEESASHLSRLTRDHLGELRPYVAVDFCELATGICQYDDLPTDLTKKLIDRVASVYFVQGSEPVGEDEQSTPSAEELAAAFRPALADSDRRGALGPANRPIANPGR
jgi:hypothetical protein